MPNFICITCGVQYAESQTPPAACPICQDERQYVNHNGQQWTTLEALQAERHNTITEVEPGYTSIRTEPFFAISQQANLIQTPQGNVLWDCISLIDSATVEAVNKLGGLSAIAISHPHLYASMVSWSQAFGNIPIYLHAADRQWVMRSDPAIRFWDGDSCVINDTITLIRCGGHFDGSTAMLWSAGAQGKGVLLTGDTMMIPEDRRYVTFAYSFPNRLPLSARKVRGVADAVKPYKFDRIYDGWPGKSIESNAAEVVKASADRYIRLLNA
jgi:glyoxylase-like metal-dependent hydrolase (beta-lactamase superfamily II)